MSDSLHIADLITKKIKGNISESEMDELDRWLNDTPENLKLYKKITDSKNQLSKLEIYNSFRKEKVWAALDEELFPVKTIHLFSGKFLRIAAAIIIPLTLAGTFTWYFTQKTAQTNLADIDNYIKPGSQKAMLILSDGGKLELSEASTGEFQDADVRIKNGDNSLKYEAERSRRNKLVFNELITPRGGGYNLELADGTHVWLNSGSTLKFPVAFTDSTRQVFLQGEAYFEVSHNGKPFIVSSGEMDVRVLGTSFNVSAYQDESEIKTTLVEGKVRIDYSGSVTDDKQSTLLTPNKQAVINRSESKIVVAEVNVSQYTSWMQGKLEFSNESLEVVMKRLARWYDFEYAFENVQAKDFHFTARISNETGISSILEMLEMTTDVKFEVREQTIVVL